MPKITAQRVDGDCYRLMNDGAISGFALKLANGKWAAFDRGEKRLGTGDMDSPRQVATWFGTYTDEQEAASLPPVPDMLGVGRDLLRLSALVKADIRGRIGGGAAEAFFGMIEANGETWKLISNPKKPPAARAVADGLILMATRARSVASEFSDEVSGDGANKFDMLTGRLVRDVEEILGPLPAPRADAETAVPKGP